MASPLELRVSVVIPNHNYAQYVGQAIESALAQTLPPFEVVVVDNGSTDDSLEVLKAFGARIRLITQENRGQSGARNRGVAECRGELIAFLDADDVWMPEKLAKQVQFFRDAEVGLVYSGYTLVDRDLVPAQSFRPEIRGRVLRKFAEGPGAVISGGESTAVIRRACFEKLGVYDLDLSMSAGWDMYRRIAGSYRIEVVRESLMLYRQHGSNASRRADVYEHDVLLKLKKMFADPAAAEVFSLRRQCYGKAFLAISGNYLHAGQIFKSAEYLTKALVMWPRAAAYALGTPVRVLRRMGKR